MLNAGDRIPNVTVNDQDGKPVNISQFKGKKVVLYFYPKDMTPGCTAEACNLRDNYTLLQKQGYEVLGVSADDEKLHQKFIAKEKLPFKLLSDTEKKLHEAFGTWVEKSMYGRKYMGTARVTFIINESGVIDEVIEKVDTKNHTSQILKTEIRSTKKTTPSKTAKKAVAKKAVKTAAKKTAKKSAAKKKK
jgi:peroxiredoxin Q/BCP